MESREPKIVYSVVPVEGRTKPERFLAREQAAERADALAHELRVAVEIHEIVLQDGRASRKTVIYTAYP